MFGLGKRRSHDIIHNPPAGEVAVPLLKVAVDEQICHHCGACVAVCPPDAIFLETSFLRIDQETCTSCERCVKMCPVHALSMPGKQITGGRGGRHDD
jgi:ferredoxin